MLTSYEMSNACASAIYARERYDILVHSCTFFLYFASNCITFFISRSFLRRTQFAQRVLYFKYISRVLLQIARASERASEQVSSRYACASVFLYTSYASPSSKMISCPGFTFCFFFCVTFIVFPLLDSMNEPCTADTSNSRPSFPDTEN